MRRRTFLLALFFLVGFSAFCNAHSQVPVVTRKHELIKITEHTMNVYLNLAQAYEAEFSHLTKKLPTKDGIFTPDTMPRSPYSGFLLYQDGVPVGFCIVKISDQLNDVAEFYVVPSLRKRGLGRFMAETVFRMYPGKWQVRQIEGAHHAIEFWRKVIGKFTGGVYEEAVVKDQDWGIVTRQLFVSKPGNEECE